MGVLVYNQLECAERELSFSCRFRVAVWYNKVFGGPFNMPTNPSGVDKDVAKRLIWC